MKKQTFLIIMIVTLLISIFPPGPPQITLADIDDTQKQVEEVTKEFFKTYEDCQTALISDVKKLEPYFDDSEDSYKTKLLISTLIKRKMLLCQDDINNYAENNKIILFDFIDISLMKNTALCKVKVTKTFNYGFAPETESVFVDHYTLQLFNYDGIWLIRNIDGLVDPMLQKVLKTEHVDIKELGSLEYYNKNLPSIIDSKKNLFRQNNYDITAQIESEFSQMIVSNVSYNRSGAVTYALQYALNPNTNYANFTDYGGDCTNFVSQVLHEGGNIPEHFGSAYSSNSWYYTKSADRSATWTSANTLKNYIYSTNSKINGQSSGFYSVSLGDIIQSINTDGSSYHSYVVTGIITGSHRLDLLITARTVNRKNASFYQYYYGSNEFIHILGSK